MKRIMQSAWWGGWAMGVAAVAFAAEEPLWKHAPLDYESSAFEVASFIPVDPPPWDERGVQREILARAAREKQRHELVVDYYRIGHALSFPLPLERRPTVTDLPPGIATMAYPWIIWLSWDLEERWRILHAAWRRFDDRAAGVTLQRELAALAHWDHFWETRNEPGLATAHIAACLAQALANPKDWDPAQLKAARNAAAALVERDIWPWFEKTWAVDKPYTAQRLVNIPVITVARAAQLARVIGSSRAPALEDKTVEIVRTWFRFRTSAEHQHTEGTAYDGYLMDTLTEWLAALPGATRAGLLSEGQAAFRSLADEWIGLTLPGRFDLHAPIGDVEPEMTFWTAALMRVARWYEWADAAWLSARVPRNRLPAATLIESLGTANLLSRAKPPAVVPREHPHAVSLRSGWGSADLAAMISVPRNRMGHLHADAGHVVLGWRGRFWITDPGYQQYRPGDERTYTIGPQAHNPPVLGGVAQKKRTPALLALAPPESEIQHVALDLTACYEELPRGARVRRDVWLARTGGMGVVVRDSFDGLAPNLEVTTYWLGGAHLAWSFVNGWARLSDGARAVWLGTLGEKIPPAALTRDVGSRGPLTLRHPSKLEHGAGVRWWVMWCDAEGSWTPPRISEIGTRLRVEAKAGTGPARLFGEP